MVGDFGRWGDPTRTKKSGAGDVILFSTQPGTFETVDIVIAADTECSLNSPVTTLPEGMLLGYNIGTKKYEEWNSVSHSQDEAVILQYAVEMVSGKDAVAVGYRKGRIKKSIVISTSANIASWSAANTDKLEFVDDAAKISIK